MTTALSKQQKAFTHGDSKSTLQTYRKLVVGNAGFLSWINYEIATLICTNLASLVGLLIRSIWYRTLFASCGKRPAIGRNVTIKNPSTITLGDKVLIDDGVSVESKGDISTIKIGDYVSLGKNSIIVAKDAEITLKDGVNVGSCCRIATQSKVTIGESTLIAAFCYIGPGNHKRGDSTKPLIEGEMDIKGGVVIGANCWIGAHSTILDGVVIGDGAVVGAHTLVKENVPAGATVVGIPARIVN